MIRHKRGRFYHPGLRPTALARLPRALSGFVFPVPGKTWRHGLRPFYAATTPRRPSGHGAVVAWPSWDRRFPTGWLFSFRACGPTPPWWLPRALSQLVFALRTKTWRHGLRSFYAATAARRPRGDGAFVALPWPSWDRRFSTGWLFSCSAQPHGDCAGP